MKRIQPQPLHLRLLDRILPGTNGLVLVGRAARSWCGTTARSDGISLSQNRRAAGDTRPVIFLTARREEGARERGIAAGATDFITKPFAYADLVSRVARLLSDIDSGQASWLAGSSFLMRHRLFIVDARAGVEHSLGLFPRDRAWFLGRLAWNRVELAKALETYQAIQGKLIEAELLEHLSPLGWKHINLWAATNSRRSGSGRALSYVRCRP